MTRLQLAIVATLAVIVIALMIVLVSLVIQNEQRYQRDMSFSATVQAIEAER